MGMGLAYFIRGHFHRDTETAQAQITLHSRYLFVRERYYKLSAKQKE